MSLQMPFRDEGKGRCETLLKLNAGSLGRTRSEEREQRPNTFRIFAAFYASRDADLQRRVGLSLAKAVWLGVRKRGSSVAPRCAFLPLDDIQHLVLTTLKPT